MDKILVPKEIDTHEAAMHKCVEEVYFGTHSFTPSVTGRPSDAPVHACNDGSRKEPTHAPNHRLAYPVPHHGADDRHDTVPFGVHTKDVNMTALGGRSDNDNLLRSSVIEHLGRMYMNDTCSRQLERIDKDKVSSALKAFEQTIANIFMRLGLDALGLPGQMIPPDFNGPLIPGAPPKDHSAAWENARQRAERINAIETMERYLIGHSWQFENAGKTAQYKRMLAVVRNAKF